MQIFHRVICPARNYSPILNRYKIWTSILKSVYQKGKTLPSKLVTARYLGPLPLFLKSSLIVKTYQSIISCNLRPSLSLSASLFCHILTKALKCANLLDLEASWLVEGAVMTLREVAMASEADILSSHSTSSSVYSRSVKEV